MGQMLSPTVFLHREVYLNDFEGGVEGGRGGGGGRTKQGQPWKVEKEKSMSSALPSGRTLRPIYNSLGTLIVTTNLYSWTPA